MIEHEIIKKLKKELNIENVYFKFPYYDFDINYIAIQNKAYNITPKIKYVMLRNNKEKLFKIFFSYIKKVISKHEHIYSVVLFNYKIVDNLIEFTYTILEIDNDSD